MGKKSGIGNKKVAVTIDPIQMLFDLPDPIKLFDLDLAGDDGNDSSNSDDRTIDEQPEALIYREHHPTKRELRTIAANEYLHQILTGLPAIGETWHCISNSRFNFWSFVPSVIAYLGNYTTSLHCATWTTNILNSKQLIELYDQGKIGKAFFVVGNYFKVREAPIYNFLAGKLLERNQTIIAGEHHAKILLLHNENNYITIESSANLCANPRTEQFTYTNDKGLYLFYKSWFDSLFI